MALCALAWLLAACGEEARAPCEPQRIAELPEPKSPHRERVPFSVGTEGVRTLVTYGWDRRCDEIHDSVVELFAVGEGGGRNATRADAFGAVWRVYGQRFALY